MLHQPTFTATTSFVASGDWSGTKSAFSGARTTSAISAKSTYVLTCIGLGGKASQSTTVTLTCTGIGGSAA